jgi:sulfur carrier protein ThiS
MYIEDIKSGMISVRIEKGGENVDTQVPEGSTIRALIEDNHLRGLEVVSTRVNGTPASDSTPLQEGDRISQVPKSGKQGA